MMSEDTDLMAPSFLWPGIPERWELSRARN